MGRCFGKAIDDREDRTPRFPERAVPGTVRTGLRKELNVCGDGSGPSACPDSRRWSRVLAGRQIHIFHPQGIEHIGENGLLLGRQIPLGFGFQH